MASPLKKIDDELLIELNSVGLSLSTIATKLGVHHTTVTQRLKALNIPPADTRRSFMEDIWDGLSKPQQAWLVANLGPDRPVKDYVRALLVREFLRNQP